MRGRKRVLAISAAVVLVGGLLGAYIWDRGQSEVVAKGVSVVGVDVGDLMADQARAKLRRRIVRPLTRPVYVRYRGAAHKLTSRDVGLRVALDAMVATAVDRSRQGWFVGRLWRELTGSSVDANVTPRLRYDRKRFRRWVDATKGELDRPPREPQVSYSVDRVSMTPGRNGISVDRQRLEQDLSKALADPFGDRSVRPHGVVIKPKLTTAQVRKKHRTIVTVDRSSAQVRLWKNFRLAKTYTVTVGQIAYETPAGLTRIQYKQKNPTWTPPPDAKWAGDLAGKTIPYGDPRNPLRAWFISFNGAAGFHGWDGPVGGSGSHGCIRMAIPDINQFAKEVQVGDDVYIG